MRTNHEPDNPGDDRHNREPDVDDTVAGEEKVILPDLVR